MKKMLLIAMISLGVLSCKKDQNDPEPQVCGYITDFGIDEGGTYIIIDDQTKQFDPHMELQ